MPKSSTTSVSPTKNSSTPVLDLEMRLTLMRALHEDPCLSQRALAERLGVSLGKTNYCLRALIEKGHVKASNFKHNPNKTRYMYQLTPQGLAAKAKITARFLKRKIEEHEALVEEIEALSAEVQALEGQSIDAATLARFSDEA